MAAKRSEGAETKGSGKKAKGREQKYFVGSEEERLMKAFQDPLRVKITAVLNEREASPIELSFMFGEDLGTVSYHVRRLKYFRVIELTDTVPVRGATEHRYRAISRAMIPPDVWDRVPEPAKHQISVGILRELWADIVDSMEGGTFEKPESHLSITPLLLDKQGLLDMGRLLGGALEGLLAIQSESNQRMEENGIPDAEGIAATVALVGFESMRDPAEGIRASQTKQL